MTEFKILTKTPEAASILMQIMMEVDRATVKHPVWPECHVKQIAFVAEEAGELVRAGNQVDEGAATFTDVKTEAIHTAATAIRLLLKLPETEASYNQLDISEYFETRSEQIKYLTEREGDA